MIMLRTFLLTIMVVLGAALALLLLKVDFSTWWPGHRQTAQLIVGNTPLRLPGSYLRNNEAARSVGEANLVMAWPSLKPLITAAGEDAERIFVTLGPPSAEPIDHSMALYARFVQGESWSNPGGLMMRRFRAGSPYQDEELYFAPPEGEVFSARCPRQGSALDIGQQNCIWLFRASGIDIQVRFSSALLPQWTRLNDGIRGLVGQWVESGRSR